MDAEKCDKEFTIFLLTTLLTLAAHATNLPAYYGDLKWTSSEELKTNLNKVLIGSHVAHDGAIDEVVFGCPEGKTCYKHTPVSYKKAREYLFGSVHLLSNNAGNYQLEIFYCEQLLTNKEVNIGPMKIPDNNVVNAEHIWPQSKFTGGFSKETQKADLHHLLPILSHVNSVRGNYPYGDVVEPKSTPCPQSALGKSAEGDLVFEPSDDSKGNVARATFYFSIRYKTPISAAQEKYLRAWNKLDPVDDRERERNEAVFQIQKDRNPFIDDPDLVDQITDF